MDSPEYDVIVKGAGNAALCAALSAREPGASVVVLECAPEAEAGGNSRFAGGVMRFAFDGVDDLRKVADLTEEEIASYPLGILVNADGRRFVDEGADFHSFTYAKYGRAVLEQPGQFAWQVFDAKVLHLLRPEYGISRVTRVRAQTLEELAAKLEDVNAAGFLRTVRAFNAAVRSDVPFDPYTRDGRGTVGLEPAKSNWANAIDQPPFEAYATTCGITFTFGGLRVDGDAQVLDHDAAKIAGSTPPARWSAGSSTSTTRAAPGSSRAPSSTASPARRPRAAGAGFEPAPFNSGGDPVNSYKDFQIRAELWIKPL